MISDSDGFHRRISNKSSSYLFFNLYLKKKKKLIVFYLFFSFFKKKVLFIAFEHVSVMKNGSCLSASNVAKMVGWGAVGTDVLIDIFVTVRLVQILTEGSRYAAQLDSITDRTPRKLFKAVI